LNVTPLFDAHQLLELLEDWMLLVAGIHLKQQSFSRAAAVTLQAREPRHNSLLSMTSCYGRPAHTAHLIEGVTRFETATLDRETS
jgi:hypothetical protein